MLTHAEAAAEGQGERIADKMPDTDVDDALLLPALRLVTVDEVGDGRGIDRQELRVGDADLVWLRCWLAEVSVK